MFSWHHNRNEHPNASGESSSSGASCRRVLNRSPCEEGVPVQHSEPNHIGGLQANGASRHATPGNFQHPKYDPPSNNPLNYGVFPSDASQRSASGTSFHTTDLGDAMEGLEIPSPEQTRTSEKTEEQMRAEYEAELQARELSRQNMTTNALEGFGINFGAHDPLMSDSEDGLSDSNMSDRGDLWGRERQRPKLVNPRIRTRNFGFFESLSHFPEVSLAISKQLPIKTFIHLYAISKDFHIAVDQHLTSCVLDNANNLAPESAKAFPFTLYAKLLVPDPSGRPNPKNPHLVRRVPGLKYLQMIHHREKTVRDILACLAREGHRTPKGMSNSLKKMWLVMDLSTTRQRVMFMHSQKYFTDIDLYNIQFFIVKLDMRFNDPIDGPGEDHMRKLMLGQRGLTHLRNLLRRKSFTTYEEIVKCQVRYQYPLRPHDRGWPIWGIKPADIGVGHLEGWGQGKLHLMRPDELVVREAVRRGLDLKNHIMPMMLWGYCDPKTGKDTPATVEEMYMSDEEPISMKYRWKEGETNAEAEEDEEDFLITPQTTARKSMREPFEETLAASRGRTKAEQAESEKNGRPQNEERRPRLTGSNAGQRNMATRNSSGEALSKVGEKGKKPWYMEEDGDVESSETNSQSAGESNEDYADSDNDIHNMEDDEFDIPDSPASR
jgi:hypothetical protein